MICAGIAALAMTAPQKALAQDESKALIPIQKGQFKTDLYMGLPVMVNASYFVSRNVTVDFGLGASISDKAGIGAVGVGGAYHFNLKGRNGAPARFVPFIGLRAAIVGFAVSNGAAAIPWPGVTIGTEYRFNNRFSAGAQVGSLPIGISLTGSYWFR